MSDDLIGGGDDDVDDVDEHWPSCGDDDDAWIANVDYVDDEDGENDASLMIVVAIAAAVVVVVVVVVDLKL